MWPELFLKKWDVYGMRGVGDDRSEGERFGNERCEEGAKWGMSNMGDKKFKIESNANRRIQSTKSESGWVLDFWHGYGDGGR